MRIHVGSFWSASTTAMTLAVALQLFPPAGNVFAADAPAWEPPLCDKLPYEIKAAGIAVKLNQGGGIAELLTGSGMDSWIVSGGTSLTGMQDKNDAKVTATNGGWTSTHTLTDAKGHTAKMTDTFTPEKDNIRWEVAITSADARPWTTDIVCGLNFAAPESKRLWSAWGSADGSGTAKTGHAKVSDPYRAALNGVAFICGDWTDPLVTAPFVKRQWHYGNVANGAPTASNFVSLPLFSVLNPSNDTGVTLSLSPENPMIRVKFSFLPTGEMQCTHSCYRLGGGRTLKLTLHLVPHEGSWRGGLRFLTGRYPQFFNPPNPKAHDIGGCGAYSGYAGKIDAVKFKKMAFGFMWKMCDDCPYFGMFIPPVKDMDEAWTRNGKEPTEGKPMGSQTSCRLLNDYAKYMKSNGFYTLNYFDATEFGQDMKGRKPVRTKDDPELWKDPAAFMAYHLSNCVLPPVKYSAYQTVVVDPGDPDYLHFMIEQLKRQNQFIPDSDGICIDRMDWLTKFNPNGDDGISLINGKPSRSLFRSWEDLMAQMGPLMHQAGKVIFVNTHSMRLESCKEVDGLYNEFGQIGIGFNTAAFIGLRKPVTQWAWQPTFKTPGIDAFMQRHLYMGCFPTVPYPYNNHCIRPEPAADQLYLDYGPLLDVMRGKKWVLSPRCVETTTPGVKVNLFEVPGGYALPVTFGGATESATVKLRGLPSLDKLKTEAILPGIEQAQALQAHFKDGVLTITVPLKRGCAMVKLISRNA